MLYGQVLRLCLWTAGGLGHLALQYARAMGCKVSALSSSANKEAEALSFGATHFLSTSDPQAIRDAAGNHSGFRL